ncbi:MAG: hypothetical protein LBC89_00805, partial [Bacteroidales bacterium]|nr:hypothetical protein [Bacteroidales bacterium]
MMVNKLQKIRHNIVNFYIHRDDFSFCFCKLLLITYCLLLITACSLTKRLPDGQFMLYRDEINLENTDKRINEDNILLLFKQHPNKSYQAFGILFYNLAKPGDSNWINRVVRNIGVAPIIYDSTLNAQSIYQISRYLFSKGHFHSEVSIDTNIVTKKRIKLIYNIKTNDFYCVNNVTINVADDSLADVLKDWKLDIKKGDPYDLNKLNTERTRLETFLRNEGYFRFNISQVSYLLDTALGNNTMDIEMLIVPPARGEHTKKYFINNISILPLPRGNDSISYEDTTLFHFPKEKEIFTFLNADYTNIKPKYIASKLLLKQGDSYSFAKTQRSFENMSDLRYFRNINFQFEEDVPDSNLLNLNIQLTKATAMTWGMDFEYTNTSGLQGLALTTSFIHRNIFKGGETMKINLRGGVELQILFDNQNTSNSIINGVNTWDFGA